MFFLLIFLFSYFAAINIKYVHNHSPDCAAILRYRTPSEDVREYFRNMFENGFSPSQAYNSYKQHLYVKYTSKYDSMIADRAICPDQRWVKNVYICRSLPPPIITLLRANKLPLSCFFLLFRRCIISIRKC